MNIMKYSVKLLIKYIIYLIDIIIPTKNNMVVFFQANDKYDDNCKILFNYILRHDDLDSYWLYDKTNQDNNFVKRYSVKGLWLFSRANFAVISHGSGDFGLYSMNMKYTIQTWHGTPIKRIGIYDKNTSIKNINTIYKESSHYDIFIVGSEIEKHYISSAIRLNENNFLISGLPRNDKLISKSNDDNEFINNIKNKKVILYAPTFRDFGETTFFPFRDFEIDKVIDVLKKEDAYLLLRPHPNDYKSKKKIETFVALSSGRIMFAGNTEVKDISDLQSHVNIIVTDYSSIYIDLLLKDIPPIFIPYDLEEYEKVRGLAYDYDLVSPGPKVFTQKAFIDAIEDAFKGALEYKEQRYFVKRMFHKYDDGKACERIVQAMKELI